MKSVLLLLFLLAVMAAAIAAVLAKRRKLPSDDAPWPFYAKRPLSQPEQVLYHRLVKALPDHIVLAQVQLSRALGINKDANFHAWNNRINRMSYDFLVCAKDSTILAAIELDDLSHQAASRAAADAKKNRATAAAGIALIRWNVKAMPDDAGIRNAIPKVAHKPSRVITGGLASHESRRSSAGRATEHVE